MDNNEPGDIYLQPVARVLEGPPASTQSVSITVRLNEVSGQAVRVDYATSDGSTIQGQDYQFQSGDISERYIAAPILVDNIDERNETFYLELSNPQNVELGNTRAIITITDDDVAAVVPSPGGTTLASLIFDRDRVEVNEGESAIYRVCAANNRGADMMVNLRSTHPQLTIEPARLVFATTN